MVSRAMLCNAPADRATASPTRPKKPTLSKIKIISGLFVQKLSLKYGVSGFFSGWSRWLGAKALDRLVIT
ncbi:MAG: hypothetical protein WCG16_03990 [Methylococcales bacterium]